MTDVDPTTEKILDAALDRILQLGIRRASLDDIARGAGLNRVTIYRRFTTKDKLVEAVLARELTRALSDITAAGGAVAGVDAQIEETMVALLRTIRTHPLMTKLLSVDPDEALNFYTVRGRQLVAAGINYILAYCHRGQADGVLDQYDPQPVAELLARLAHSLMLTPSGGLNFDDEKAARRFVQTAIVPLLKHGTQAASVPVAAPARRRRRRE